MFGLFKSKKEKLYDKYNKLMKQSYNLSTKDRAKSDLVRAEAEVVMKQLEELEKN